MVILICIEHSPLSKLSKSKITELTNNDNHDSLKFGTIGTRMHHNEHHRSCVVTLSDMEFNVMEPCHLLQTLQDPTRLNYDQFLYTMPYTYLASSTIINGKSKDSLMESIHVHIIGFRQKVFMRDLSALVFLMKGELNFLVEEIACLQSFDLFKLGQGVMHAHSGLWWIILPDQTTSPTMLCADRCSLMQQRMALFTALRCVLSLQDLHADSQFVNHITKQIQALSYHLHSYYWLDLQRLNDNHQYKAEENLYTALNNFSVMPESVPDWIFDFMPSHGGYFIVNVSPGRIDFCCFCLDYLMNVLRSTESPNCQRAMNPILPEWCDTSPALLPAFGISMIPGRMVNCSA
uniref:Alkaline/neutral invertase n=1 Tax=Oryza punctata TaxID=4537 RepID=A0A0E0LUC8_ORYPU